MTVRELKLNILGNETELHSALCVLGSLTDVESLPLELDDIPLLEVLDFFTGKSLGSVLSLGVCDLIKVVILLQLLLGDEVIVVDEGDWDQGVLGGRLGQPCNLLGGLLEITLEMKLEHKAGNFAGRVGSLGPDKGISPVHGGDLKSVTPYTRDTKTYLLVVTERSGVLLLHDEV
jgi:hypothetical protein